MAYNEQKSSIRGNKAKHVSMEIVADGMTVTVHTRETESYEIIHQPEIQETILLLRQTGTQVLTHQELQQRYAVIDESVVWYGNVDFFAFGRKDAEVLRFVNSDVAGELLELSQENCEEQMMIEERKGTTQGKRETDDSNTIKEKSSIH